MAEESSEVTATASPLLAPSAGIPDLIDTDGALRKAIDQLGEGAGPFAVDAERASGYKYSARAYLIQIKRRGGGLHLIDPIPFGADHPLMNELAALLSTDEFILHASTQDLPCLRELGINPATLFDSELAGRIAGLPRVGLGPMVESLLGLSLAKEHSAADWSIRPLPIEWLNYAALDVEVLIELREKIGELLEQSGKLKWAEEEFASILAAPPAPPRIDPWRRTSGTHKIKRRNHLAVVRELWNARNDRARELDISPGRILSDGAIVELALASDKAPLTKRRELEKVLRPLGLRARWFENTELWISAISRALALKESEWPEAKSKSDSLPPIKIWRDRFPERYAPLSHARALLHHRAEELSIPVENLISPECVRRVCWRAEEFARDGSDREKVVEVLAEHGARAWQIELAAPVLTVALCEREPLITPETGAESETEDS